MRTGRMLVFALLAILAMGVWLSFAVRNARRAALTSATQSPLNCLTLALHSYHETYGCLPPAYVADENGKPMHSWRVLLLPFVDGNELYKQYDFREPWDGPNNRKLFYQAPRTFQSWTEPESKRFANIVVIQGAQTAFPYDRTTRFEDFTDGQENTILLTEVANSDIIWTEPRDLDVQTMSFQTNDPSRPSISAVAWRRPFVTFGDSIKAWPVPETITPAQLQALTTIAGGEATGAEAVYSSAKRR